MLFKELRKEKQMMQRQFAAVGEIDTLTVVRIMKQK
jgi:DNA-binding XRE family transcriptional regulator